MPQQYVYRPNMNRNVTRKWAEARQVDYDGDDWGADPYDNDDYQPSQPPLSQGGRSFTNPAALNTSHRLSFDQGQEQRVFSAGAAGAHSGFPSTTQSGSSQYLPQPQYGQDPYSSRSPEPVGRISTDSSRRAAQLQTEAHQSVDRPFFDTQRRAEPSFESTGPSSDAQSFPPRKSSLSQSDIPNFSAAQPSQASTQAEEKPLPFVRPADIYKRMEQEREKERLSQESSRPSMDSVQRAGAGAPSTQTEPQSRTRTDLDPVPERKSEYGMEGLMNPLSTNQTLGRNDEAPHPDEHNAQSALLETPMETPMETPFSQPQFSRTNTNPMDNVLPSEQVQHDSRPTQRPALPELGRMSTFGSDFFRSNALALGGASSSQPMPSTQQQFRDTSGSQASNNAPYRSFVDTAFQSEPARRGSPSMTDDSLLRSDTRSTSQISPIVSRHEDTGFGRETPRNLDRTNELDSKRSPEQTVEDLGTPRRLGTNRRDSPSPARKATSVVAPTISEPQSAVLSPSDQDIARDTATEAQLIRPGPAILVHQKATSSESVPRAGKVDPASETSSTSALRNPQSQVSDRSELSDQRTASEEYRDWSNQRKEFNERHGFKDSNPTTPGLETGMFAAAPFDRSLGHAPAHTVGENDKALPAVSSNLTASRPTAFRDESFRPQLPGGWESSRSIERAAAPSNAFAAEHSRSQMPPTAMRTESAESIPTAGAPRDANWRSQYTGPQGQSFAAAQAAGKAMAGIFNGPALTSRGGDSEVSSINEQEEHPAGRTRDSTLFVRDFGSSESPPPAVPDQSSTRDFANVSSPVHDVQTTPRASQQPFAAERASTASKRRRQLVIGGARAHSPSRDSEKNWWSDEDDDDSAARADAPAPLRTNRLSTIESHDRKSPSLRHDPRVDSDYQDQLESDIFKSLTPKSSNIDNTVLGTAPHLSPTRTNEQRAGSPPFAAAALALSPGRNRNALQEQNTFKPLSDPETPTSQKSSGGLALAGTSFGAPSNRAETPTEQQSALTTGSSAPTFSRTLPDDSLRNGSGASRSMLQTHSGDKNSSIMPDAVGASHTGPTASNDQRNFETSRASPHIDEDRHEDSHNLESTVVPAVAAAGLGVLVHDNNRSASFTADHDSAPHRIADATDTTPSKHSRLGGPVQAPQVSATNAGDSAVFPSTPSKTTHGLASTSPPSAAIAADPSRHTDYDPNRAFPDDKVPVEKIFGMGTAQERIQAYRQNREVYTQPVGHLENWLSHMNNGEHADAFASVPLIKTEYGTPNSKHRREDSNAPSGTKQMQEDGKRLIASASKYGAKAGVLGKGLLSKGKEKLRTVSASQKGGTTSQKSTDMPEYDRSVSDSSAPQLPTPVSSTPLGESSFSAYFPSREQNQATIHSSGAAVAPPFSPISEVSTNQNEFGRSVSAFSADQSHPTTRQAGAMASATHAPEGSRDDSNRRSVGAAGAFDPERGNGLVSTDRLRPGDSMHRRNDSSVSDVSSVSDTLGRQPSQATRTISPPIEHQMSRDNASSVSPMPTILAASDRNENQRSHHAPSYSTAMASKEEEAARDRVDEQSLPAYNQSAQFRPSKIAPGTQIVPIARLRQDQEVRAEEPRPFSFAGSETLLNKSHGTNQSIDNPGVNTGSLGQDSRGQFGQQGGVGPGLAMGPSVHGHNVAGERDGPQQPSRILTQAAAEDQYRIPGPYGHELRSPRPKGSSPTAEQFRSPTSTQPPVDAFASSTNEARPVTDQYTPFPPQMHAPQPNNQQQALASASMVDTRPGMAQVTPSERDRYDAGSDYTSDAEYDQGRGRGRSSKLSALFKPRSKSRSRRLQKEKSREQRPDNSRRSSLFKLGRNSMQRDSSYDEPVPQVPDERLAEANSRQQGARPQAPGRQLSNRLLGDASFPETEYTSPIQHGFATSHKRKRFSGLFGKSQTQVPTRASTMPIEPQQQYQQQQQSMPDQMTGIRRTPEPQSAMTPRRTVTFDESRNSHAEPRLPKSDFHQQATLSPDSQEAAIQRSNSLRQLSGDRGMSQAGSSMSGGRYGPTRQDTGQSDTDPYNNWLLAQRANNEQTDQHSAYPSTAFARGPQEGPLHQHENRPYPFDNGNQYQSEEPRPVLPRLNTGENYGSGAAMPASAPPVSSSYMNSRQDMAAPHANMLPQDMSNQQYQQHSFPQPPSLAQYNQHPATRAAGSLPYMSGTEHHVHPALLGTSSNTYDDRQVTSPHPMSPGFSDSNTLVQPLPGAFNSMPGHYHANEKVAQPLSQPAQQSTSRISPHVAALHKRSRSPKLGRRSSDDFDDEFRNANSGLAMNPHSESARSPVAGLGTFSNKRVSPAGGIPRSAEEQEKPWAITLPGDEEERRQRADDPQSATSSKAREMRRMMLEQNATAGPDGSTHQSDTLGGAVQEPQMSGPKTTIISPPVSTEGPRAHEHEPVRSHLPAAMAETRSHNQEPVVPARPANRPSRLGETDAAVSVLPGTQRVNPPVRKTTPITIGRPTTPSFMLRRDASLRGKGPRTSTSIDEAGRASILTGLPNRSTTPGSFIGDGSRSTSMDHSKRSRSSSWNSKDASRHEHDSTIPGRSNTVATATPGDMRESGSPVPPVPSIPAMQKDRAISGQSQPGDRDPSVRERGLGHDSSGLPLGGALGTAAPTDSHSTKNPIIPTTTNTMPSESTTVKPQPANIDTNVNKMSGSRRNIDSTAASKSPAQVFEMMGSRPDGYESDDEPFMSATAYPGQEWQPVFDRWDDE